MLQIRIELPMDAVRLICRRYQVCELAVFGAALREDFGADSQVEFLVEFEHGVAIDLVELLSVQDELAAALGRRVTLVPKAGLRPQARDHAVSQAVVVYTA